jgi:hypothetical protein
VKELKWLVVALVIIFFFIVLLIVTKLTIIIMYRHSGDDDQLTIKFKAWLGLFTYKISVPLIKIDDDSLAIVYKQNSPSQNKGEGDGEKGKKQKVTAEELINQLHDAKTVLHHVVSMDKIVRQFLKKVTIKKIEWNSTIGIDDAALTGMATGALWAVKGSLLGLISHYTRLKDMPKISVTPNFQQLASRTDFRCMIQFRIGNAMLAGIKVVKYWKGGRPKLRSGKKMFVFKDRSKNI